MREAIGAVQLKMQRDHTITEEIFHNRTAEIIHYSTKKLRGHLNLSEKSQISKRCIFLPIEIKKRGN